MATSSDIFLPINSTRMGQVEIALDLAGIVLLATSAAWILGVFGHAGRELSRFNLQGKVLLISVLSLLGIGWLVLLVAVVKVCRERRRLCRIMRGSLRVTAELVSIGDYHLARSDITDASLRGGWLIIRYRMDRKVRVLSLWRGVLPAGGARRLVDTLHGAGADGQ